MPLTFLFSLTLTLQTKWLLSPETMMELSPFKGSPPQEGQMWLTSQLTTSLLQLWWSFLGANSFDQNETAVDSGILRLNRAAGQVAVPGPLFIGGGGTVDLLANGQIDTFSDVTLDNMGTLNLNGNTQTVNSLFFLGTFNGGGSPLVLGSTGTSLRVHNTASQNGTIQVTGDVLADDTLGTATLSTIELLGAVSHLLTVTNGGETLRIQELTGALGTLNKQGAGTLEFIGSTSNSFPGTVSVGDGLLVLNKTGGATAIAGDLNIGGGTVRLDQSSQIANTSDITMSAGTLNMNNQSDSLDSLTMTGGTVSIGFNSLILLNASTSLVMHGGTSITNGLVNVFGGVNFDATSNGTATIDSIGLSTSINFNIQNGTAANDMEIGRIAGSGIFFKQGLGTVAFTGASPNINTNIMILNNGLVSLQKNPGVVALPQNVVSFGGGLEFLQDNQIATTASIFFLGSANLDLNSTNQEFENLTISAGSYEQTGGTLTLNQGGGSTALLLGDGFAPTGGTIALTGVGGKHRCC